MNMFEWIAALAISVFLAAFAAHFYNQKTTWENRAKWLCTQARSQHANAMCASVIEGS